MIITSIRTLDRESTSHDERLERRRVGLRLSFIIYAHAACVNF